MQIPDHPNFSPAASARAEQVLEGTTDAAAPVIDRECMAEMWDDAGPALFQRLARLFVDERRRYVAELHAALRSDARQDLRREAHSLKSSAAYICAERLRLAALDLERVALTAAPATLAQMVDAVDAEADIADAELARAIAEKLGGD